MKEICKDRMWINDKRLTCKVQERNSRTGKRTKKFGMNI